MVDRDSTPAGTLTAGSKVRLRSVGTVTSAPGSAVVALQTDEGLISVDPAVLVEVVDVPLPITLGSVVRASVNGGAEETLTLGSNNAGNQRWFSVVGRTFLGPSDAVTGVKVIFTAPAVPIAR